ncbi:MAG: hypothetical protein K6G17_09295 [Oscillospiraceae bacterium]|nr:hypothetical protein [Oscillospiraceae bacterium]
MKKILSLFFAALLCMSAPLALRAWAEDDGDGFSFGELPGFGEEDDELVFFPEEEPEPSAEPEPTSEPTQTAESEVPDKESASPEETAAAEPAGGTTEEAQTPAEALGPAETPPEGSPSNQTILPAVIAVAVLAVGAGAFWLLKRRRNGHGDDREGGRT